MKCFFKTTVFIIIAYITTSIATFNLAEAKKKATVKDGVIALAVEALSNADLESAANLLQEKSNSKKASYLLREITKILIFENQKKPPAHFGAFERYQNIGIAYHNLLLYLRARDIDQPELAGKALSFYKRAKKFAPKMQRHEVDLLTAALLVMDDKKEMAEKIVRRTNISWMDDDFQIQCNFATYYAAIGDVEKTVGSLQKAHEIKPKTVEGWLETADDFYLIKNDPEFKKGVKNLQTRKQEKIKLLPPKPEKPKLKLQKPVTKFRRK